MGRSANDLLRASHRIFAIAEALSSARDLASVMEIVRRAARELTGADGVTFVLREGELVHYADEDAIAPLWKGRRFPIGSCISGFAIEHRETVSIEDVYLDPRIPHDLYRATFVRSLLMVPVRVADPLGAIGAYWAQPRRPREDEITLLQALASVTALALASAPVQADLARTTRTASEPLAPVDDDLRAPSQLARGELHLERAVIDLAECVRAEIDRFADRGRVARSPITIDAPKIVVGEWDHERVAEVVARLLASAIEDGDGNPIEVHVGGDRANAHVRVCIRGRTSDDRVRAFERAAHAEPGQHADGLSIARRLVEAHGGRLDVESRSDEGSTFTVVLPRASGALA